MSSPYPRHECPRCRQPLGENDKRCPNCGYELRAPQGLSTGCVLALLFLVGYPVLAVGTCFVVIITSLGQGAPSGAADALFPTLVFVAPAVVLIVVAWLILKNRRQ